MATAFGAEGSCIIHMLAEIEPRVAHLQPRNRLPIRRDAGIARTHQAAVRHRGRIRPAGDDGRASTRRSMAARSTAIGPTSAATTARSCRCAGPWPAIDAWISAIRKDQTSDRARRRRRAVGRQVQPGEDQPASELDEEGRVELHHRRTTCRTIRCTTRAIRASAAGPAPAPVGDGEDERAGRWAGKAKKECGLHVIEHQDGSGI